jgi:light-regulated signal transduction histidine kinase (bacteriophytochrome)
MTPGPSPPSAPESRVPAPHLSRWDPSTRLPVTIQPHGILFALAGPELRVAAVSANAESHLGQAPSSLIGLRLEDLMDAASVIAVRPAPDGNGGRAVLHATVRLHGTGGAPWRAVVKHRAGAMLLEALLPRPDIVPAPADLFQRFDEAARELHAAPDIQTACRKLAKEVAALAGHDRVKIYRFMRDWSGEVFAEENSGQLASYHGLRFPETDIPQNTRTFYERCPVREIPDTSYKPVGLLQIDQSAIDLHQAMLLGVSATYQTFLRNLGAGAAVSVSIPRAGGLWGIMACHHATPRYLAPELREAIVLLAAVAAWKITALEDAERVGSHIRLKAIEKALLREADRGHDYREALLANCREILELVPAGGLVLRRRGSITTLGPVPRGPELQDLLDWLSQREGLPVETDFLPALYPPATGLPEAAGLLTIPFGEDPQDVLAFFRAATERTIVWAGNPVQVGGSSPGHDDVPPRADFLAWPEQQVDRSRSWERQHVAKARGLRDSILDTVLRRILEHTNAELTRVNEELESFVYIASHDLREPLRRIEMVGTLLENAFRSVTPRDSDAARWFTAIQTSARRLRLYITDLAAYAMLSRDGRPFNQTSLDALLDDVCADLGLLIAETQCVVDADPLPVVMCDSTLMRQVLLNVIGNALKYRHSARNPLIEVRSAFRPARIPGWRTAFRCWISRSPTTASGSTCATASASSNHFSGFMIRTNMREAASVWPCAARS